MCVIIRNTIYITFTPPFNYNRHSRVAIFNENPSKFVFLFVCSTVGFITKKKNIKNQYRRNSFSFIR